MGAVCPYGFHEALAKNIPLVQIGGMVEMPSTIIMKGELAKAVQANIRAFEGHSIGRLKNPPTLIDYTNFFINVLKSANVKYVEKYYPSWAAMQEAVAKGELDATLSTPPYDQEFVDRHPDLGIFELRSVYSNMPCCRQLVTRDQLKDKKMREKYVKFERALIRAHKYYKEHKPETADIVARFIKVRPQVVRQVFLRPGYTLDPNPNVKGAMAFYKTLKDNIGKQDVRESVDTSVYEDALLSLSRENRNDDYYRVAVQEYRETN